MLGRVGVADLVLHWPRCRSTHVGGVEGCVDHSAQSNVVCSELLVRRMNPG
jgi:hypothetical protein